jgi:fructose-bisphosphate aldolase class II
VPVARTADVVGRAYSDGTGVAAFNVITLEHAEGIVAGAERAGLPVIVQVSQNAVRYHGGLAPLAAAVNALSAAAAVDVALHLDHVTEETLLHLSAQSGFSSVMFDAAGLRYDDNVSATRAAAEWAHGQGLWLEAELGYVGGKPDAPLSAHAAEARTDPAEAAAYVAATGADALAVAVGSSHAMTSRTATLDLPLVQRLRAAVDVPLVLHGSSGVTDAHLRAGVRAGLTKVNVGTALNVAYTAAVRAGVADPAVADPRPYLTRARDAVADAAAQLLETIARR